MTDTINIQLTGELKKLVDTRTGKSGLYTTPYEYVSNLIRRDIKENEQYEREVAEMLLKARSSSILPYDADEFFKKQRARIKERAKTGSRK